MAHQANIDHTLHSCTWAHLKRTSQVYFPSLLVLLSIVFASVTIQANLQQVSAEELLSEDQLFQKFIERATSAYKDKRYEAAIKHYEGALMVRSNPNIHWNLSVCFYKLRRYKEALSHANEELVLVIACDRYFPMIIPGKAVDEMVADEDKCVSASAVAASAAPANPLTFNDLVAPTEEEV